MSSASQVEVHLRDGCASDRAKLENIQRRASLTWEEDRQALLAHPEAIGVPLRFLEEGKVRVAEIAGTPVGFSVALAIDAATFEIDGLFVDTDHWRKGIGRALIVDAIRIARAQNAQTVVVTANLRAADFYAKLGFVRLGPVQTQFGVAVRMRRPLDRATP